MLTQEAQLPNSFFLQNNYLFTLSFFIENRKSMADEDASSIFYFQLVNEQSIPSVQHKLDHGFVLISVKFSQIMFLANYLHVFSFAFNAILFTNHCFFSLSGSGS